jgi:hypothetical protein
MDPAGARLFVTRLLTVSGWHSLLPGLGAQAVRRSAYPERHAHEVPAATAWLVWITHDPGASVDRAAPTARPPPTWNSRPATQSLPGQPMPSGSPSPSPSPNLAGRRVRPRARRRWLRTAAWAPAYAAHYTVTERQEGTSGPDDSLLWPGDLILMPGADGSLNPHSTSSCLSATATSSRPTYLRRRQDRALQDFPPIISMRHTA